MKRIKDLEKFRRPREKMLEKGAAALSDQELLAVVLGSGNGNHDVGYLAERVLEQIQEKNGSIGMADLVGVPGLGQAKSSQVLALLEYGRRCAQPISSKISRPQDVFVLLGAYRNRKQEHFIVLTLDGANQLIEKRVIFIGTLNASMVHPREVFAEAIADRAASIILAHNHPSGQLSPSVEDMSVTERLCRAGELLGIDILDHVIFSAGGFLSMKETHPAAFGKMA